jgi:toxin YoeB
MGKYQIKIHKEIEDELSQILKAGKKKDIEKINALLIELSENPFEGSGRPEKLKYKEGKELWSRRINKKDRMVYLVLEEQNSIVLVSVIGHYQDK